MEIGINGAAYTVQGTISRYDSAIDYHVDICRFIHYISVIILDMNSINSNKEAAMDSIEQPLEFG